MCKKKTLSKDEDDSAIGDQVGKQIINSGSKPRLPIDQINDCRIQHKCAPTLSTSVLSTDTSALQSIRPNEVPVGVGGRDIIDTPNQKPYCTFILQHHFGVPAQKLYWKCCTAFSTW